MSRDATDQELVARVQQGDKAAFDVLVLKYQHRVVKLVGRYVRDQAEVYDVAQDAFIKAYRALPNFRGDSAFYTWLYRISINTAKNYLVAHARRAADSTIEVSDAEQLGGQPELRDHDSPEHEVLRDELEVTVLAAIDDLPEDLRTALILREIDGMSYEEISVSMDCPIGTVRSRIFRAREAVNERIADLVKP